MVQTIQRLRSPYVPDPSRERTVSHLELIREHIVYDRFVGVAEFAGYFESAARARLDACVNSWIRACALLVDSSPTPVLHVDGAVEKAAVTRSGSYLFGLPNADGKFPSSGRIGCRGNVRKNSSTA